mgnify:CR=1
MTHKVHENVDPLYLGEVTSEDFY